VVKFTQELAKFFLKQRAFRSMNGHDLGCKCAVCRLVLDGTLRDEAIQKLKVLQEDYSQKYGFYIHFVSDDPTVPMGVNIHTHGLYENFGHLDFQIVIILQPKIAHSILHNLVDLVRSGKKFSSGDQINGIIRNFPIKFLEAKEGNRKVLRLIFPDPQGKIDFDEINDQYKVQYYDLDPIG
jgi:hypothetical protein